MKSETRFDSVASKVLLAAFAVAASAAETATGLEEVVVTATKRDASAQDVPFSLSVATGADLARRGITDFDGIARAVPGVSFTDLGPGQSQLNIRGISGNPVLRDDASSKSTVGVYLDEVPVSVALFTPDLDLFDVARVEVLRGPQGTLFGAGSLSGTVRYIANAPADRFESALEASVSDTASGGTRFHAKGMVNLALSNTLAARLVGTYAEFPGFIDAVFDGGRRRRDVNDAEKSGVRLTFAWTPSERLRVAPRFVYQKISTGGFPQEDFYSRYSDSAPTAFAPGDAGYVGLPVGAKLEQFRDNEEGLDDTFKLADVTISYEFAGAELTSTTAFIDRSLEIRRDFGFFWGEFATIFPFSALDIGRVSQSPPRGIPSALTDGTKIESMTQELRLVSTGEGPMQWVVGAFYLDQDRKYRQLLLSPGFGSIFEPGLAGLFGVPAAAVQPIIDSIGLGVTDATANTSQSLSEKQFAAFSELSYEFRPGLTATVGLRWSDFEESKDFVFAGFLQGGVDTGSARVEEDGFNPRFILSYQPRENLLVSAQASRGFRPGGTNDLLPSFCSGDLAALGLDSQSAQGYASDDLWDYEINVKSSRSDRRLSVNGSLFHMKYSGLQAGVRLPCGQQIRQNVGDATSRGAEIELQMQANERLYLQLSGSYVDAELDSAQALFPGRAGDRLPLSPEYTLDAIARYTFPVNARMRAFAQAGYHATGEKVAFFLAPGAFEPAGNTLAAYGLASLRVGVEADRWDLAVWVDNLTDERAELSIDTEFALSRRAFTRNRPRTIGVTFGWHL